MNWEVVVMEYNSEINMLCVFYSYSGRPTAASPATGSKMQHLRELKIYMDDAMAY